LKEARMFKQFWIILLLVLLNVYSATANVLYVDCSGPNDPGSGTSEDPFRRIQTGLDAAGNGNTVQISPGVYTGAGNYDLDPNGKSIIICSSDPNNTAITASTIIDPDQAGRGFYLHNEEDSNCHISGFTIINARAVDAYNGAGIYCYSSSPTISNCIIRNCRAVDGFGGGICNDYGGATVINCTITNNTADYYGGGISCISSSTTIIGCTISGNVAGFDGGGIFSGDSSNPNILNCIIINNHATVKGGGINCFFRGVANVINCTIAGNSAEDIGGAVSCSKSSINITNSILWANSADVGTQLALYDKGIASIAYCDLQGGQAEISDPCQFLVWGSGNIDSDPCFGTFNPNGDPNLWDFHLQSTTGRWYPNNSTWVIDTNLSPCIDAGDPNSDWTAEPWPNGKRINMGAYGGTAQASKSGNIADFDINGKVDFIDFALFAEQWNQETNAIEDINRDGVADVLDLDIFTDNWLWSRQ
jgi:parallel beta-helix repeat protein